MKTCIYRLISPSGKSYIGQTVNFNRRIGRHKNPKVKDCPKLNNAIIKYGFENFTIEILEECKKEDLNNREVYWITKYDSINNGYNSRPGGDSNYSLTEETKEKIRKANKGKYYGVNEVPIIIDNIYYKSISEASRILKIKKRNISHRLQSNNEIYNNYSYVNKENPIRKRRNLHRSIEYEVDGIKYPSIREAAKHLGVHPSTLSYRLKKNK